MAPRTNRVTKSPSADARQGVGARTSLHMRWSSRGTAQAGRSVDVVFDRAVAITIGEPDGYGTRPGFWHQRGGIAACWYGAAAKLAETLRDAVAHEHEPHAAAHLGALDAALAQAKALLREAAEAI